MKYEAEYKLLNTVDVFNQAQTIEMIDRVKENLTPEGYEKFMTSLIFDKPFTALTDIELLMILDLHASLIFQNIEVEKNKAAVTELESKVKTYFQDIYEKHLSKYFSNVKEIYSI